MIQTSLLCGEHCHAYTLPAVAVGLANHQLHA